jgi:hypothetical protein
MTQEEDDRHCPTSYSNGVDDTVSGQYLLDIPGQSHNVSASPSIETYLLGSFWPGVIGFGSQEGYESYASDQHGLWTNGADIGLGSFGQSFE